MKQLTHFPDTYWQKFSEQPVALVPFNPKTSLIAQQYITDLNQKLATFSVQDIYHRGSTALGIDGKGDIEIGVVPADNAWYEVIVFLANYYQGLGNLDDEYCRFNDRRDGYEIEIILMRRYTAVVDKKLHAFLSTQPVWLTEYEQVKYSNSDSKRQYMKAKDAFFRRVIEQIPD